MIAVSDSGYSNVELNFQWLSILSVTHERLEKTSTFFSSWITMDHITFFDFTEYCSKHDIVPFGLPTNLIHLRQPLDVVFQPLKHYHAQALNILVRDGITQTTELEFLGFIE